MGQGKISTSWVMVKGLLVGQCKRSISGFAKKV